MGKQPKKLFANEEGAMLIEFGLMLPLIVIMMLFLIICYDFVHGKIELQVNAFATMRRECSRINANLGVDDPDIRFVKVTEYGTATIIGGMHRAIRGMESEIYHNGKIQIEATVCSYAGVHKGLGDNSYMVSENGRYRSAPEVNMSGLCR